MDPKPDHGAQGAPTRGKSPRQTTGKSTSGCVMAFADVLKGARAKKIIHFLAPKTNALISVALVCAGMMMKLRGRVLLEQATSIASC